MTSKKAIDQDQREYDVRQAIANTRLEGLEVSAEYKRLAGEYVAGEATLADMKGKLAKRYGIS